jgi:hypothetical protein
MLKAVLLGGFGGTIRLHHQAQIDAPGIGNQEMSRQGSATNGSGHRVLTKPTHALHRIQR